MFAALLLPMSSPAQSDVLWRRSMPQSVQSTRLDTRGHLLVFAGDGITALAPDAGEPAWRFPIRLPVSVFRPLSADHLLLGSGRTLALIDVTTGVPVWQRTDLPEIEKTAMLISRLDSVAVFQTRNGLAVIDLVTGATAWDSTALPPGTVVREFFPLRAADLLLIIAKTPASAVTLMGVALDSGIVRWVEPKLFRSDVKFQRQKSVEFAVVQPPIRLPDSTAVLYFSTEGPVRIDPRTGAVLWRSRALAGAPVPATRDGYPRSRFLDSLLVVPSEAGLVGLDLATGEARWSTAGKLPDRPRWLVVDSSGIATGSFGGNSYLAVLGLDGVRRRPTDWRLPDDVVGRVLNDSLFLGVKDELYVVPLATGVEQRLASIGFEGQETPREIDTVPGGGLLVMGRQNLVRIDRDGTVVYRRYYPAPASSFWEDMAFLAGAVGGYVMIPPSYAWSASAPDYYYIFTAKADSAGQKGFSLVALDRGDGREVGRMWFEERNPHFILAPASGTVFQVEDKTKITARRFAGFPVPGRE